MKNYISLAIVALVAAVLYGCAIPVVQAQPAPKKDSAVRTEKYGYVDRQIATMRNYGVSTYEIVAPVAWEDKHKCSVLDFVTYATIESDKNGFQDVINIRAEELCKTTDGDKKCSCKYWGLGIRYRMLTASEAKEAKEAAAATEMAEPVAGAEQ